jgi:hypothetical protein
VQLFSLQQGFGHEQLDAWDQKGSVVDLNHLDQQTGTFVATASSVNAEPRRHQSPRTVSPSRGNADGNARAPSRDRTGTRRAPLPGTVPGPHGARQPHRPAPSRTLDAIRSIPGVSAAGATTIKVASVADFGAGQTIMIDTGASLETAVIATVGTAGATTVGTATNVGATVIPVASGIGFTAGQSITIDSGANQETAVVASATGGGRGGGRGGAGATITVAAPLKSAHAAGAQVSGSGITLTTALTQAHASGTQVAGNVPTPGAPNKYYRKPN